MKKPSEVAHTGRFFYVRIISTGLKLWDMTGYSDEVGRLFRRKSAGHSDEVGHPLRGCAAG